MTSRFSRRKLLEVAPGMMIYPALSLRQGSAGATADQVPQIQTDAAINLNDPAIFTFIFDPTAAKFEGKAVLSADDQSKFDVIPNVSVVVGTRDQDLVGAKREYYATLDGNREVRETAVDVLYKQPTKLTILSVLLIAHGVTDDIKSRIIQGFTGYTLAQDPTKYALEKMGTDIKANMFAVRVAFTLEKTTPLVPLITRQRDNLFKLYDTAQN